MKQLSTLNPTSYKYKKLDFFDGIELLEANNEVEYFPFHKHDSFCISLITSGTEVLENREDKFLIPSYAISITQVNEAHKNYSLCEYGYSYKTIYVNQELITYLNNGKKINRLNRIIYDVHLFNALFSLFEKQTNVKHFEENLKKICFYNENHTKEKVVRFSTDVLDNLIEKDIQKKINIELLANKFYLSKYHFIREFKKQTGITPQNYITLFKLQKAKRSLSHNHSIKDTAYDNGFYDLSHFSNTFKRFYGVTPSQFLKAINNSNIIQAK